MYLVGIAAKPLRTAFEGLLLGSRPRCQTRLGVRDDCKDRDPSVARTVPPQDTICGRSLILGVGLEDLFPVRTYFVLVLMGSQTGMPRIVFEVTEGLPHGLQTLCKAPIRSESFELSLRFTRKRQLERRHYG